MTETPPPVTTWPTLEHERIILAVAADRPDWSAQLRSLLHRIRELEAEAERASLESFSRQDELGQTIRASQVAPPLTKAHVEAAAEKLFVTESGRVAAVLNLAASERIGDPSLTLPDVVHLLCSELGIKE